MRRNSPAPVSKTSENATCDTISALASGLCTRAVLRPCLSEALSSTRAARQAGAIPNKRGVASDRRSVKSSTRLSGATSSGRVAWPADTITRSNLLDQVASAMPRTAPSIASRKLSVSNWRITRNRPAPMDMRTAISRCRLVARARRRLAMLVQAINKTSPTATIRTRRGFEN